ncbi:hypothetical protein [Undibacterium baiyunense]|uniref:Uncharacterized protein n=1 Tax=Undibacterium baiyunense TaxID=2828731 RepID=A0A941I2G4_9BURK|nr:hypothetical protein [Undibacterium baiyunense]MBR7744994.1 hypothetical protein [Undibacterium baiyunense]
MSSLAKQKNTIYRVQTWICLWLLSMSSLVQAYESKCTRTMAWKEATHLKRTSYNGNLAAKAEWKLYSDATYSMLEVDGKTIQLIQLENGLSLTYGKQQPNPSEFINIASAVAGPMWDDGRANLPRFPKPCDLKDGESYPFNERDFIYWKSNDAQLERRIYGSLKRQGFVVSYAMEIKRGKSDEQLDSLYGTWEYQSKLEKFPETTEVQGWHLFRGNVFLQTLPTTSKFTLRELLLQY